MGAVWSCLRSEWRTQWRTWLALAALVGLVGGVVLGAAAGARRTATAYPRLLEVGHASDALVAPDTPGFDAALRRLPEVVALHHGDLYNLFLTSPHGPDPAVDAGSGQNVWTSTDRVKVLEGRLFDVTNRREVMVDPALAARYHLHPGARFQVLAVPMDDQGNSLLQRAYPMSFTVSAVVVFDNQVVPVSPADALPQFVLTPAFARTSVARSLVSTDGAYLTLRPGTNFGTFRSRTARLASHYPLLGGQVFIADLDDQHARAEQAISPEAIALALFALLAGLMGLAVIGQIVSRQLLVDAGDHQALRALGMDRRQLLALSLLGVGAVAVAGAVLAVVIAVAASPLMPIGAARLAEPSPGVEINVGVILIGLAAVALLPVLVALPAARRAARPAATNASDEVATGRTASLLARTTGLATWPASMAIGLRLAFASGRGRRAVPVRSALVGTTVALGALVAAIVFGTSLDGLVSTPRLYGQTWDTQIDFSFGAVPAQAARSFLASDHDIAALAGGNYGSVQLGGQLVPAVGVAPLHGRIDYALLHGRSPVGADEIALGGRTLAGLHAKVGDVVTAQVNGKSRRMRIVGEAVFPAYGYGNFTPTGLGNGAAVDPRLLPTPGCAGCYNFFLVRYTGGTNRARDTAALTSDLRRKTGCLDAGCAVVTVLRPTEIDSLLRVQGTPLALGVLLAVLAVASLAHALVTTIGRRRRDLAILKTLGFRRRQVSATVAWQSVALGAVALVVGIPLGVAAGRLAWTIFANSVGVAPDPTVPVLVVLALVPLALVVANAIAAGPAWVAGRVKAGRLLRAE